MKRILFIIVDLLIIYGSILLSFYLLAEIDMLEDFQQNFEAFTIVAPFIGLFYFILMYVFELYNLTHKEIGELVYTVLLISISLMIGIMGVCFLVRDVAMAFPRSVILLSTLTYFVVLTLWRALLWYVNHKLHGKKKIIIIYNETNELSETIKRKCANFYQILYECKGKDPLLSAKIEASDEVFICSDVGQKTREKILPICINYKKNVCFVPKYFDVSIMSSIFYKTDDIPTFCISNMELSPEERFLKRFIDLLFGVIAVIVTFPFALITFLFVKLDGAPAFYTQERLTEGGKTFKIFKFRTMVPNAEKLSGPVLAEEKDPRITKVGKFLRMVRLDELPQLINILKGEMSIVGPRPERPFFTEQFEQELPEYHYRLKVKAGLTGLAQVEGKYNTTVEDKLRYDLIYINNYSIWKDFLIMLRTIKILFLKSSTEGIDSN
ncbi:MAG: sugar transferase [Dysgonamonadaceae bacterium]|jgi:exopolysaccharide biosynthesis polyprenyl glycosylphosphotransferase|nr:sugar transferase [Dysgonamonadaceae bacterium]